MATMQHKVFSVREFCKTVGVPFVPILTSNFQLERSHLIGITNLSKLNVFVKEKVRTDRVYQFKQF